MIMQRRIFFSQQGVEGALFVHGGETASGNVSCLSSVILKRENVHLTLWLVRLEDYMARSDYRTAGQFSSRNLHTMKPPSIFKARTTGRRNINTLPVPSSHHYCRQLSHPTISSHHSLSSPIYPVTINLNNDSPSQPHFTFIFFSSS